MIIEDFRFVSTTIEKMITEEIMKEFDIKIKFEKNEKSITIKVDKDIEPYEEAIIKGFVMGFQKGIIKEMDRLKKNSNWYRETKNEGKI